MPLGIFASMLLKRTGAEAIYQSIVIAPPPTALFKSDLTINTSLFIQTTITYIQTLVKKTSLIKICAWRDCLGRSLLTGLRLYAT